MPATIGFGSTDPTTTRAMPCARIKAVHAGCDPDMAAGFKRVDDRGASQIDAVRVDIVERHTLRMRATIPVMVSGGENPAITYHHRAYQRIRVHPSRHPCGPVQEPAPYIRGIATCLP